MTFGPKETLPHKKTKTLPKTMNGKTQSIIEVHHRLHGTRGPRPRLQTRTSHQLKPRLKGTQLSTSNLSMYPSVHLSTYPPIHLSIHPSNLSIYPSIYLSIYLPIHTCICLSIYLSNLSILSDLSYPILSCLFLSFPMLSNLILSCLILWYIILSYPIQPILSYLSIYLI